MSQEVITTNGSAAGELVLIEPMPADQSPALVYLAGLTSEHSRRTMRGALNKIAHELGVTVIQEYTDDRGKPRKRDVSLMYVAWGALRFQYTALVRSSLAEKYKPATANKMLSALRGALKAAWRLGHMSEEERAKAADLDAIAGETLPAGRSIPPGELEALMRACEKDQSPAGVRDAAMIALLYSCGLRRAELVALDIGDYDQAAGELVIRGKRRKERKAHVVNGAAAALADWLTIRGDEAGAMFWPIRKGGHVKQGRLTTQAVYHMLCGNEKQPGRAQQAGIESISPHDFRRSFISDLLDAGADTITVQKLAGHASPITTSRYDRRPEAAKRKAVELLHVPYRRRILPGAS